MFWQGGGDQTVHRGLLAGFVSDMLAAPNRGTLFRGPFGATISVSMMVVMMISMTLAGLWSFDDGDVVG